MKGLPANITTLNIKTAGGEFIDILPSFLGKLLTEVNDNWIGDVLMASTSVKTHNLSSVFFLQRTLGIGTSVLLSDYEKATQGLAMTRPEFIDVVYDAPRLFGYDLPAVDAIKLSQLTNIKEDSTQDLAYDVSRYLKARIALEFDAYTPAKPLGNRTNVDADFKMNFFNYDIAKVIADTSLTDFEKGVRLFHIVLKFCKFSRLIKNNFVYNLNSKNLMGWIHGDILDYILIGRAGINWSTSELDENADTVKIGGILLKRFDDMSKWFTNKQYCIVFPKTKSFGYAKNEMVPAWYYGVKKIDARDKVINYAFADAFAVLKPYAMSELIDSASGNTDEINIDPINKEVEINIKKKQLKNNKPIS